MMTINEVVGHFLSEICNKAVMSVDVYICNKPGTSGSTEGEGSMEVSYTLSEAEIGGDSWRNSRVMSGMSHLMSHKDISNTKHPQDRLTGDSPGSLHPSFRAE